MISLPRSNQVTRPLSRPWLLGALFTLLAIDFAFITINPFALGSLESYLIRLVPVALSLVILTLTCRILRSDVGLQIGSPKTTFLWVAFPAGIAVIVGLLFSFAVIVTIRLTEWKIDIRPTDIGSTSEAWDYFLTGCILAPIVEETLYRGVLVSALDRQGRRWIPILCSAGAFILLHVLYGRPLWAAVEYGFAGAIMAWAFLRSRSLLTPILLHALGNAAVLVKDLCVISYPSFFRQLLGYE